jgi:hypothetical protein
MVIFGRPSCPEARHDQQRRHCLSPRRAIGAGTTGFGAPLRKAGCRRLSRPGDARACRLHRRSRHRVPGNRLGRRTLGFADYAGNRQYITIGNLADNDRAYLFLLDFAARRRLKIWGRARVVENDPALLARLIDAGYRARPERAILFTVEAWDVNCTQHITARFTESEIADATVVLRERIAALEAENARLRARAPCSASSEGVTPARHGE